MSLKEVNALRPGETIKERGKERIITENRNGYIAWEEGGHRVCADAIDIANNPDFTR